MRDAQGEGESDDEEDDSHQPDQEEEDEEEEEAAIIEDPFQDEGYRVGSPSGIGPSPIRSKSKRNKKTASNNHQRYKAYGSSNNADPRWYGTGGYTGKNGDPESEKADRALERLTELERVENENEMLRKILEIKEENERQVDIARDLLSKGIMNPATTSIVSPTLSLGSPRNRSGGITSRNNSLGSSVDSIGGGALGLNAGNPAPSTSNEDASNPSNELSIVSNTGHHYAPATSPRATLPTVSLPKPRRDSSSASSSSIGLSTSGGRRSSLSPTNKPLSGSTPMSPTSLLPPPPPKPPAVDVDKVMVEPPSLPNEEEEDEDEEETSNSSREDDNQINSNVNNERNIAGLPSNFSPSRKNIYSGRNSNVLPQQQGGVGMTRTNSQDGNNFRFETGKEREEPWLEGDDETSGKPYNLGEYHSEEMLQEDEDSTINRAISEAIQPPGLGISSPSRNGTLELQSESNGFEGLGLSSPSKSSRSIGSPLGNNLELSTTSNYDSDSLPPPPLPAGTSSPPLISQEEATAVAKAQQAEAKLALNSSTTTSGGGGNEESDSSEDGNSDSSENSASSSNTSTSTSNDEKESSSSLSKVLQDEINQSGFIAPSTLTNQESLSPPKAPTSTPLELEDEDEFGLPPPPSVAVAASKVAPVNGSDRIEESTSDGNDRVGEIEVGSSEDKSQ